MCIGGKTTPNSLCVVEVQFSFELIEIIQSLVCGATIMMCCIERVVLITECYVLFFFFWVLLRRLRSGKLLTCPLCQCDFSCGVYCVAVR